LSKIKNFRGLTKKDQGHIHNYEYKPEGLSAKRGREDLCVKGGIFVGGFLENWQDKNLDQMKRGFLRGLSEKRASSSFFRSNRAGELSASGLWQRWFRRLGHEGLWQEGGDKEESTGNTEGHSPVEGTGGGRPATERRSIGGGSRRWQCSGDRLATMRG
jgi:hypothetical protein